MKNDSRKKGSPAQEPLPVCRDSGLPDSQEGVKWVSPTGMLVMYQDGHGNVRYEFPEKKHPQPRAKESAK